MAEWKDVCDHFGVVVRVLNDGYHVQFVCDGIIGNFYPTTNKLFIQRPALSLTRHEIRHKDALLAYLGEARSVLTLREEYLATSELASDRPPSLSLGQTARLREEYLRLAARRPSLLLEHVPPREFEFLIAQLLQDEGFDVKVTKATRDGGRDIVALRREGLEGTVMFVECKQWSQPVGIDVIQRAVGVRYIANADHSLIVTASRFTGPARAEAMKVVNELTLADAETLKDWLRSYDLRRQPFRLP